MANLKECDEASILARIREAEENARHMIARHAELIVEDVGDTVRGLRDGAPRVEELSHRGVLAVAKDFIIRPKKRDLGPLAVSYVEIRLAGVKEDPCETFWLLPYHGDSPTLKPGRYRAVFALVPVEKQEDPNG
jgi:hypothetical protein